MERKNLYISSCRKDVVDLLSEMIRNLGRKTHRPIWGKSFSPGEDVKALLYLDSGGRGNLALMAKSMDANLIEYMFVSEKNGQPYFLISELLKTECKAGEYYYKSTENTNETFGKRVKALDGYLGKAKFFAVNETPFERSRIYSARKSEIRCNIVNGSFDEGNILELIKTEELPNVILCDAFTKNGALAIMGKTLGKHVCVHIIGGDNDIYAPASAMEREIFIGTEEYIKESLSAICLWLMDCGEYRCKELLYRAFAPLKRGEELILRATAGFMKSERKRRSNK